MPFPDDDRGGPAARAAGFTLIELMIVVAVIAILSAIALPSLARARMAGNEASCIASLRTVLTVNEQYRARFGRFAGAMTDLQSAGYVDNVLGSSVKSGYDFFYAGGIDVWTCLANPRSPGRSGDRYFFSSERGVIRFNSAAPAGGSDPPIE